jgi:hypothetical protein
MSLRGVKETKQSSCTHIEITSLPSVARNDKKKSLAIARRNAHRNDSPFYKFVKSVGYIKDLFTQQPVFPSTFLFF